MVLIHGTPESRLRLHMSCSRAMHASGQLLSIKLLQAREGSGIGDDALQLAAPRRARGQLLLLLPLVQSQVIGVVVVVVVIVDSVVVLKLGQGLEGAANVAAAGPEVGGGVMAGRRDHSSHGLGCCKASLATSRVPGSLRAQAVSTHLFLELCRRLLPNTILIL